jgi:hypothetical protein
MSTRIKQSTVDSLLASYGIARPATDERFLSHGVVDVGVPLTIGMGFDPTGVAKVRVAAAGVEIAEDAREIAGYGADGLVDQLREKFAIPGDTRTKHTLAHLVTKCARLFLETGIDDLRIETAYLTRVGYRVQRVSMRSTKPIKAHPRLDPDAHDRHAVFAGRRTGQRALMPFGGDEPR